MTLYVCQCPHLRPAKVWTAESEAEIIDMIVGDGEATFNSALDAALDDMRDAYVTDDVFDLWLWISGNEAPLARKAPAAFLNSPAVRMDVEAAAAEQEAADDVVYTAFDGRFTWSENDLEWRLGNREPVTADDLVAALCAASLEIAFGHVEEQDV